MHRDIHRDMHRDMWPVDSAVERAALYASAQAVRPGEDLVARAARIAGALGLAAAGLALVAVIDLAFGHDAIARVIPGTTPLQPWTAIDVLAVGLLLGTLEVRRGRWFGVLWYLLPTALAGLSLVMIGELIVGASFGIDVPWPFNGSALAPEFGKPSLGFLVGVVALSVAAICTRRGLVATAQSIALATGALALFSINSYALGAQDLFNIGLYQNMPFASAALLVLLSISLCSLKLGAGPLRVLASPGEAGALVRRVLPSSTAGLLILATAANQIIGRTGADYTAVFAVALSAAMLLVNGLVAWQAVALHRVDVQRTGAEQALEAVRELMSHRDELTRQLDESSRVLRQVIDTSPDAFVSMDEAGRVTAWNPAAEAIFGWTRDEVLGKPLHALIVPEFEHWVKAGDFPDRVGNIEAFRARSKDVDSVRKDGTRIRVDLTLWPATEEPSRAYYAFARDVTVKREAEERLLEANSDLREFAAIAAHDLRNPLVAVRLAAEMLAETTRDGVIDEQGREWIGRIQAATLRGQDLISDLLEYSSLSSGPRETTRVDLTRLVEEVADQVAVSTDRSFAVDLDPLPIIEGDLPRLRQLFANLLGNAVKYVPHDRSAVVGVSARTGRRMVRIIVTDNGDGIPDADKATVFGAFQRGSANRDTPGTGIGLAICRKVAERHGGTIRIEDNDGDGHGATFVIELPRWPGAMTIGLGGDVPASLASGYGV